MVWFRKWMILIHRWLGIVLSLLFVLWFVSGIAMIFARGMPSLTPEMRLDRLPALDFAAIKIPPSAPAEKAQLDRALSWLLTVSDPREIEQPELRPPTISLLPEIMAVE